jgi:hypothetical protein
MLASAIQINCASGCRMIFEAAAAPEVAGERNPPNLLRACVPHQNALDVSSRRGGFADCGIHARHNLLRHQLHGAFVERGIDPVHAGIDQLPEIAGFLA